MMLAVFLIGGAIFHSCKKDEVQDVKTFTGSIEKVTSDYELPLIMRIDEAEDPVQIGYATITHDPVAGTTDVVITIDNMSYDTWYVTEAHLYIDADAPAKAAPGKFDYHWCNNPLTWGPTEFGFYGIDDEIEDYCVYNNLYYAIHAALMIQTGVDDFGDPIYAYPTAWVLPEDGIGWYKHDGETRIGWGMYFQWNIDYIPVVTGIDLSASVNEDLSNPFTVTNTGGFNFEMCLDPAIPYYYFDAVLTFADPDVIMTEGVLNGFLLNDVEDPGFWAYWLGRGVDGVNNAQGWELLMWDIINGDQPMFYVKRDGGNYMVIDGLQYLLVGIENPLRINGDYYPGTYSWTGILMGDYCDSESITIGLTISPCPE